MYKLIGKYILILPVGILAGTIFLWISYLIPLSEDSVHVIESMDILEQEGWYPVAPLMLQHTGEPMGRNGGGIMDNFTDSIMVSTAGRKPVEGPLYQAMNMASKVAEKGYSYYWHGYVIILRPLLCFLNYADIRVLNQLLQMAFVMVMGCILYHRKGLVYAAMPLTIYGFLMPMAVSQALQYSWVFYIGMSGSLFIVKYYNRLLKGRRLYFLFMALGMLTSYFDLLTYPLFTWGIPMIWWIVMDDDQGGVKKHIKQVVLCGIHWIIGYGGLWAGKWLIGEIITHKPIIEQAWNEVLYRAGRMPGSADYLPSYQETILSNLRSCISVQVVFLLGIWIVWWIGGVIKNSYRIKKEKTLPLLLISLSPICWYVVLHDHTYIHSSYTYRICIIGLTALLASMICSREKEANSAARKKIIPVVIVLFAILAALNVKDDLHMHNGYCKVVNLELDEDVLCIQKFQSAYNRIGFFNIYLDAESEQSGEIEVKISKEDGSILGEHSVRAEEIVGGIFYEVPADFRLDKNETYEISILAKNLYGNHVWIGVTETGLHPLGELSSLQMGDEKYDAQLIFGVLYRYRARLLKLVFAIELQLLIYWNFYLLIEIVLAWIHRQKLRSFARWRKNR